MEKNIKVLSYLYKEIITIYQQKNPKKITPQNSLAKKRRLVIIGLLGNQKPEPKLLGTRYQVPNNFQFRYGLLLFRHEMLGNQTETSSGSGTRSMNTPSHQVSSILAKSIN